MVFDKQSKADIKKYIINDLINMKNIMLENKEFHPYITIQIHDDQDNDYESYDIEMDSTDLDLFLDPEIK